MKKIFSVISICLLLAGKLFAFTQIVTVQNFSFAPSNFTINLGDTVKWTYVNGSMHTTTSTTIPAGAVAWNAAVGTAGATFTYVPKVTGIYNYVCTPHQTIGMKGKFTVVCPKPNSIISAASATTFCSGGSVLLKSNTIPNITAFQWKKNGTSIAGATASTFTAKTTGSYTLVVTNSCGKKDTSNAISVTVNPLPPATITPSDSVTICSGDSIKLQANTGTGLTYQWQKNGVNIAGATKSSFTAKTAGNYKVIVTRTSTGCKKASPATKVKVIACFESDIARNDDAIRVFPNPSSGDFHLVLPLMNNNKYVMQVFDENGNIVANVKNITKDYMFGSDFKPGIYLIQVSNGNDIIYKHKVIKE